MDYTLIVNKLIGEINPVGETTSDDKRFENLKAQCGLVEDLLSQISTTARTYKDSGAFSVKRSGEYAAKFLKETIKEIS